MYCIVESGHHTLKGKVCVHCGITKKNMIDCFRQSPQEVFLWIEVANV